MEATTMRALKAYVHRLHLLALTAALGCAVLPSASGGSSATNPLAGLLAKPGNGSLCFRRVYDEAHLHGHPGQLTTAALLSLDPGADNTGKSVWLKLQLRQKGQPSPANVGASCEWSARANTNTSGTPLIPAYPRNDGFACIALYSNQAAEEAGMLMLDLAPDGRTVTAYFPDEGIGLWGAYPEHTVLDEKTGVRKTVPGIPPLHLGPDDRVLRLVRTEAAACSDMERSIDLSKG